MLLSLLTVTTQWAPGRLQGDAGRQIAHYMHQYMQVVGHDLVLPDLDLRGAHVQPFWAISGVTTEWSHREVTPTAPYFPTTAHTVLSRIPTSPQKVLVLTYSSYRSSFRGRITSR